MKRDEIIAAMRGTLDELDEAEQTLLTVTQAAVYKRREYDLEYASQRVMIHEVRGHTEATRQATVALQTADLKLDADLAQTVADATAAAINAAVARATLLAALLESTPMLEIHEVVVHDGAG